jgi:CheY-like chemotaxis protein
MLVVDDDPDSRTLVRLVLWQQGHIVLEARSGSEALAALRRREVDEVVIALRMRGSDGADLAAVIRTNFSRRNIRVGFYSGENLLDEKGRFVPIARGEFAGSGGL